MPAVNQIETHPFKQNTDYQELMRAEGVQIESWGPFAEGKNGLFTNETLAAIGAAHGKSVAQVVLRSMIQRGVVVIPKSVNPDRMAPEHRRVRLRPHRPGNGEIADLDSGTSLFFEHSDPQMVRQLGGYRLS